MCLFKPWSGAANHQQGTLELKCSELGRGLVECQAGQQEHSWEPFLCFLETVIDKEGSYVGVLLSF